MKRNFSMPIGSLQICKQPLDFKMKPQVEHSSLNQFQVTEVTCVFLERKLKSFWLSIKAIWFE